MQQQFESPQENEFFFCFAATATSAFPLYVSHTSFRFTNYGHSSVARQWFFLTTASLLQNVIHFFILHVNIQLTRQRKSYKNRLVPPSLVWCAPHLFLCKEHTYSLYKEIKEDEIWAIPRPDPGFHKKWCLLRRTVSAFLHI